jgi:hypothetical protein
MLDGVHLDTPATLPLGKKPQCLLNRGLGESHSQYGKGEEERNLFHYRESNIYIYIYLLFDCKWVLARWQ